MNDPINEHLRKLHPLQLWSPGEIVASLPILSQGRVIGRGRARRDLDRRTEFFPLLGDHFDLRAPFAWLGFRWIASTVNKPPPRPVIPWAMDLASLAELFPDLAPKLSLLGLHIIQPDHLHEFLAGIHGWKPSALAQPSRPRRRKLTKRFASSPGLQMWIGVDL